MGRKPIDPANEFSTSVVAELERLRVEQQMSHQQLIEAAGLSPNYYFTRLRGEKPLTTNDVHALAKALGCKALFVLKRAAERNDNAAAPVVPLPERQPAFDKLRHVARDDTGEAGEDA